MNESLGISADLVQASRPGNRVIFDMARTAQIPALTGLRGAGALWVFLHHYNYFYFGVGNGIHVLAEGFLGVDLFFMLSGFVMSYSKCDELRETDWLSYCRFLVERVVRLYPANAAVLILYALAAAAVPSVWQVTSDHVSTASSFVTSLLLAQSWVPVRVNGWIVPGWSVSAEMGAYILLPGLLFFVTRIRAARDAFTLAGVALAALVLVFLAGGHHDFNVIGKGGLLRLAFEFTAGALLFQAWRTSLRVPVASTTALIAALLLAALTIPRPEASFLVLPAFALLLLVAAQDEGPAARLFASRPAMFLGRISYSLYLVHWPVLMFWLHFTGRPPFTPLWITADALMVAVTIGLAAAVHRAVEAPSHRLARRVSRLQMRFPTRPQQAASLEVEGGTSVS